MAMYERHLLFYSPALRLSPRTKLCTIRYILGRGHFRYTSHRTCQRPRQGPRLVHIFHFATPLLFTLHPPCTVSEHRQRTSCIICITQQDNSLKTYVLNSQEPFNGNINIKGHNKKRTPKNVWYLRLSKDRTQIQKKKKHQTPESSVNNTP